MSESHAATLLAALHALDAQAPRRIEFVTRIDSTNAELLRRDDAEGTLLIADAQHAGRGRLGRTWQSPPGSNLYVSYAHHTQRPLRQLTGLSLVAGIACATALRRLGVDEAGLKWPNDLFARMRKLGGILVELGADRAVIGIGVNVEMPAAPTQIEQAWIDLATLGARITRIELLAAIVAELLPMLAEFERDGFAPFAERWPRYDVLIDRTVRVIAGTNVHEGHALGVDAYGRLRVRLADGESCFHSADVSLRLA